MSEKDSERDALIAEYKQLKERKRAFEKAPYFFFDPYNEEQERFLFSPAKIRICTGGNRAGKSTLSIIEMIAMNMGFRHDGGRVNIPPPPVDTLYIVKDKRKSVDKIIMRKLKQYWHSLPKFLLNWV